MYDESGLVLPYGFEEYEEYPGIIDTLEFLTIPSMLSSCCLGWEIGYILTKDLAVGLIAAAVLEESNMGLPESFSTTGTVEARKGYWRV